MERDFWGGKADDTAGFCIYNREQCIERCLMHIYLLKPGGPLPYPLRSGIVPRHILETLVLDEGCLHRRFVRKLVPVELT